MPSDTPVPEGSGLIDSERWLRHEKRLLVRWPRKDQRTLQMKSLIKSAAAKNYLVPLLNEIRDAT